MSILAIVNTRIIDIIREKTISNGAIVIKDDIISDIGSMGEVEIPSSAEVIDGRGYTALPGLIDAHIHITGFRSGDYFREALIIPYETLVARAIRDLEAIVDAGFTSICDAGSSIAIHLKPAANEGTIKSPRIFAAGYPLSQTFGHGDIHFLHPKLVDVRETLLPNPFGALLCDGVDECRKAARYALREGADFIKIFTTGGVMSMRDRPEHPQMTIDEIKAVVEEASRVGKFVHAHAEGAEGFKNALIAGVKVLAHGIYMDDECINLAIEKGAVVIPTLTISEFIIKYGREIGLPEWGLKKEEEVHDISIENARKAYKAGVKLATGTDLFVNPIKNPVYGLNAMELKLFVEKLGMKPFEAIKSATLIAAEATGLGDKLGALEKGRYADIILVSGDPLDNIDVLLDKRNIKLVVKNGEIVKREF